MYTSNHRPFKILQISIVGSLCFISAHALCQSIKQDTESSNPGTWKTIVLQNAAQIKVPESPDKTQTQKELSEVKQMMAKHSPVVLRQIKYWDAGSPAYRWNEMAYKLTGPEFRKDKGRIFWRGPMAWMNLAIYDATIAAWKLKYAHQRKRPFEIDATIKTVITAPSTPSYPCEHAVTAGAAATVLAHFFPDVADSILTLGKQAAESRVYAGVQFPSDIAQGWKLGEQVAAAVIEKSKNHFSDAPWQGSMPDDPKGWRGEFPIGAVASTFKPLVLKSGDQFRPPAPPDFSKEMEQLKNFKQNFYTSSQAFYWAAHSGLDIWTDVATTKMFEYRMDENTPACARIYTLLNVALYDCAIAIMDAKYAYFGIRPDQLDTDFHPLIGYTPPFPGYPSGHATAASTAATVLSHFFPEDANIFKQTARECADSRFYAGIHFPTDNRVGLELGEKLGNYVVATLK